MKNRIGLFSEGNNYYSTFFPLVEEFLKNDIEITYYSLDKNDKIFQIQSEKIKFKYLGKGIISYLNFLLINVDILVSTTPNIGCKNYNFKKPLGVGNLIHIFHSVSDISIYRKGSLDNYDTVILCGDFQKQSIRELEEKRGLAKKKIVSLGVPYLDYLYKEKSVFRNDLAKKKDKKSTVLIASSWGSKGCFEIYGVNFIKLILKKYKVILRPHPYSLVIERKMIDDLMRELNKYDITWDLDTSPTKSMQNSDILISDTSSIRFDYSLIYNKPLITLDIPSNNMKGYEIESLNNNWIEEVDKKIWLTINKSKIARINSYIQSLLSNKTKSSSEAKYLVKNLGKASEQIVKYITSLS